MNSNQLLIDQLKITRLEIQQRKDYLGFSESDRQILYGLKNTIAESIDTIIDQFYQRVTVFSEMDQLIGDAETLRRLKLHQRNYVLSLFDGQYDEEYVQGRLRVGVVHKRIGVDPKFYISSVSNLISILGNVVSSHYEDHLDFFPVQSAIQKIIMFDLSLVMDTYIHSLMEEVKKSKAVVESYASSLEERVAERTEDLVNQARHDGLTGLLNQQAFYEELRREISRAQRHGHTTSLIYFDLDNFKMLNDTYGHKRGDEILVTVSDALISTTRTSELAARYGGDEFCVVMPETSVKNARKGAKRICEAIEKSTAGSGISLSIGIAASTLENLLNADSLVRQADKAMYEAKKEKGFVIKLSK